MDVEINVGKSGFFSEDWRELIAHYEKLYRWENERPDWVDEVAWEAIIRGRALEAAMLTAGRCKSAVLTRLLEEPGFRREYERTLRNAKLA